MTPRDFYDPEDRREDMFERVAGEAHRASVEAARVRNAEIDEQIKREEAEARENHRIKVLRHNGDIICAEYRAAGVDPIEVNADGVPTVSLSMLRWIGWKITVVDGQKKLVQPDREQRRIDPHDRNS